MPEATVPVLDHEKIKAFGTRMFNLFGQHEKDRLAAEQRWLQNLRQFRGIYDPEVAKMIQPDQSKAYPKLTRWKVIGTVARLMQMLFPQTEENYGVNPSPLPTLSKEQLQEVLDGVQKTKAEAEKIPLEQVQCTDKEIEDAIYEYAKEKSDRMAVKIKDDLKELEYVTLARRVVFSAVLYNVGILEGPLHTRRPARKWVRNEQGRYVAQDVEKLKPLFDFCPVWENYPDMTAKSLDKQDGTFRRHVMARWQVEALAKRPDFLADQVNHWLREHAKGNHKIRHWEADMNAEPKSDRTTVGSIDERKYEVYSYWGEVSGHELKACGVNISDDDLAKSFQAEVWELGDTIIKARLAPFGTDVRRYHYFVFEEDDLSLLGNGQCDTLRDSQLSLCEVTRAALDDASITGTDLEVNEELLVPGHNLSRRKNKTWRREGTGIDAQTQAVRNIPIQTHLAELIQLRNIFMDFADKESGLPPPSLGDVSAGGSEALRTQQNASMFLGAAALPIRDTVRNFDTFTISVIGALVKWNMKYDPSPSRDGDFDIIARGSTSLIAKEVLAQSLDLFKTTLDDEEKMHVDTRKLLVHRAKARDIPVDEILLDEKEAESRIAANAAKQQQSLEAQEQFVVAQMQERLGAAVEHIAKAKALATGELVDVYTTIIEALTSGTNSKGTGAQGGE